jgi:hypothetical protein
MRMHPCEKHHLYTIDFFREGDIILAFRACAKCPFVHTYLTQRGDFNWDDGAQEARSFLLEHYDYFGWVG